LIEDFLNLTIGDVVVLEKKKKSLKKKK